MRRLSFFLEIEEASSTFRRLAVPGPRSYARLTFAVVPQDGAAADAWNFGLCATRSCEPRQARKGATVAGSPRVPRRSRSSSHRFQIAEGFCRKRFEEQSKSPS